MHNDFELMENWELTKVLSSQSTGTLIKKGSVGQEAKTLQISR